MFRIFCKSKLHHVRITQKELEYEGSITIDTDILEAAGMAPYEKVQVLNLNNGERFETYIIPGETGAKNICLNGPAARKGEIGDKIIVVAYAFGTEEEFRGKSPKTLYFDENNNIVNIKN
ncbi:aspartate 1-decarboxylase [bacterium]|nr:aspartate 1-decarboxylase [bacterium]